MKFTYRVATTMRYGPCPIITEFMIGRCYNGITGKYDIRLINRPVIGNVIVNPAHMCMGEYFHIRIRYDQNAYQSLHGIIYELAMTILFGPCDENISYDILKKFLNSLY